MSASNRRAATALLLLLTASTTLLPAVESLAATTGNVCQQASGQLQPDKPGGDSCLDEATNCASMFGPGAMGPLVARTVAGRARNRGEVRDDSCDDPANAIYAARCPYTCATCCMKPAYACDNDRSEWGGGLDF